MSIAAAIIGGLTGLATTITGGVIQSKILREGQEEARALRREELVEARRARRGARTLGKEELAESRRQFELGYGLQKEQLGMQKESMARESFRNQVSTLTNMFNRNEQLKSLFINRLSGLRG